MGDIISRDNFKTMPPENQALTLFDLQVCTYTIVEKLDQKLDAMEKQDVKDRRKELAIAGTMGAASGLIGGVATVWSYIRFWK